MILTSGRSRFAVRTTSLDNVKRLKDVAGVEDTSSVTVSAGSFPEVTLHENKNTKVPADYAAALVDADIAEQVKS